MNWIAGAVLLALAAFLTPASASAQVSPGPGVVVLKREVLADDVFFLYSAETRPTGMFGDQTIWLGGWSKLANMPRDRIFMGEIRGGALQPELRQVLKMPGALVNDPSVIQVPGSSDLRMYFTALSLDDVEHATERNVLWTARSADGGAAWTDVRQVIGQDNGLNSCGGWSPSALVEEQRICVYYHGNSPCLGVYRTCFMPDGVSLARPTQRLSLPFGLANVDVTYQEGRYVMVGDVLGLDSFVQIRALESADGRAWRPLRGTTDGLLVRADTGVVFTPHVSWRQGNVLTVLFSTRSSLGTLDEDNLLHRWTIWTPSFAR